jgi:HAMP domain-containing protein
MRKRLFIIATGCLLLLITTFLLVKFSISIRLDKISNHFREAATTDNCTTINPLKKDSSDEISTMAESFNSLAEKLCKYHSSLQEEMEKNARINQKLKQVVNERQLEEAKKEKAITELKGALEEIKTLQGILPICCHCKKIRDDKGNWNQIEVYIRDRSEARFSHGICPDCLQKHCSDHMSKK